MTPAKGDVKPKPDGVEIPDDKEWDELRPQQRHYYKNREKYNKRNREEREERLEWYREEFLPQFECQDCGEECPAVLEFHHLDPDDKEKQVSTLVRDQYSEERIREEVEKCVALCRNCHKKRHTDWWQETA